MNDLLSRSQAFEEALVAILGADGFDIVSDTPRHRMSSAACLLSIEHASAVRITFAASAPNSGTALLRLQYEALLRGAWALFAASDLEVSKLSMALDADGERVAGNLLGGAGMLDALIQKAPAALVQPLQQFQDVSKKALNSFVHSGIHPLRHVSDGFPQELAEQLIRNSNGLMHMSYRLLASLSGSQDRMNQATRLYTSFPDCLPMK